MHHEPIPEDQSVLRGSSVQQQEVLSNLLSRICHRDERALKELKESISRRLLPRVRAVLQDDADVEEVLADVFLNVWRHADRYDCSRGTVINWLSEMSFFRAIDRARRAGSGTGSVAISGRMHGTAFEAQGSPEELLVALQEDADLEAAVDRLSLIRRTLIVMSFFHQLSHAQIAERTQLPLGTIKSHIRRALVQLRCDVESTALSVCHLKAHPFNACARIAMTISQ